VWRIVTSGPDGRREHAVKWFRAGYRTGGSVAAEYAALAALDRAVAGLPAGAYRVRCPRPVRAWDWGYAMSAVPGCRLDRALARGLLPAGQHRALAADLVAALGAFHTAHGGPYGDFHAGNVLLGPDHEVYLIDPAPANPDFFRWPPGAAPPPLAVDLGYWTFVAATRAARRPRTGAEALRFAGTLRDAAAERTADPGLAAAVEACLADYWARLSSQGPRRRLVAMLASRVASRLARAVSGG
jgi:hypothetical protein